MAQAVAFLVAKKVSRIILARPAVEAGEKLGFLPGDLQEKVNPYLRPLYDALYDMLDVERVGRYLERGTIEIAPIAFMRGRTLNDSFVILDEAQNTTSEQMKMFLTRLGFGSKAVITGDITQIDLPPGRTSGLVEAMKVVSAIEGISFIYFDERDVVRHKLVRRSSRRTRRTRRGNGRHRVAMAPGDQRLSSLAPAGSSRQACRIRSWRVSSRCATDRDGPFPASSPGGSHASLPPGHVGSSTSRWSATRRVRQLNRRYRGRDCADGCLELSRRR